MFSFNNEIEDLEDELRMNEQNNMKNEEYDEEDDDENDYNYEEVSNKNNKPSNKSSKDKEEENYIYVAENGDLHYVDQEGNIFKCREEDGDFILEEQIFSSKENTLKSNKNKEKNEYDSKINHKSKKNKEEFDLKDNDYFQDEKKYSSDNSEDKFEESNQKEVIFEEFVFVKNDQETQNIIKGKNITKNDSKPLKLEIIHKLRDKARILVQLLNNNNF